MRKFSGEKKLSSLVYAENQYDLAAAARSESLSWNRAWGRGSPSPVGEAKTAESLAAARPALLPRECWAKLRELVVLRFVRGGESAFCKSPPFPGKGGSGWGRAQPPFQGR